MKLRHAAALALQSGAAFALVLQSALRLLSMLDGVSARHPAWDLYCSRNPNASSTTAQFDLVILGHIIHGGRYLS
jgi:hypothetical protein